jgi:D-amino peptidase
VTTTVLISADMEGVAAAATSDDVTPGTPTYPATRGWWTEEIDAVSAGLFEAGADDVVVVDAHGDGCNLDPNMLDRRVRLIRGRARTFGMLEGIDSGIQAAVFLGYHGTVGSGGVLGHAFITSGMHALRVNGQPASEGTVNAKLAAHFGVPVILVSGDNVACAEAEQYAPQAERVVVKQALGRFVAASYPSAQVLRELREAAAQALQRLPVDYPTELREPELCAEIEFSSEACALAVTAIPGVRAIGVRTVSYTSRDAQQWYRCLGAIWTLARAAQGGTYA